MLIQFHVFIKTSISPDKTCHYFCGVGGAHLPRSNPGVEGYWRSNSSKEYPFLRLKWICSSLMLDAWDTILMEVYRQALMIYRSAYTEIITSCHFHLPLEPWETDYKAHTYIYTHPQCIFGFVWFGFIAYQP